MRHKYVNKKRAHHAGMGREDEVIYFRLKKELRYLIFSYSHILLRNDTINFVHPFVPPPTPTPSHVLSPIFRDNERREAAESQGAVLGNLFVIILNLYRFLE